MLSCFNCSYVTVQLTLNNSESRLHATLYFSKSAPLGPCPPHLLLQPKPDSTFARLPRHEILPHTLSRRTSTFGCTL